MSVLSRTDRLIASTEMRIHLLVKCRSDTVLTIDKILVILHHIICLPYKLFFFSVNFFAVSSCWRFFFILLHQFTSGCNGTFSRIFFILDRHRFRFGNLVFCYSNISVRFLFFRYLQYSIPMNFLWHAVLYSMLSASHWLHSFKWGWPTELVKRTRHPTY